VAKGAGGAGRRREGARATRSVRLRAGLAAEERSRLVSAVALGRCLTVACVVRSTARVHGFRGLEPGAGVRLRECNAGIGFLETDATRARPAPRTSLRETEPRIFLERALEEKKAQESTDPAFSPWPGSGSSRGRASRGEQSFEAGVAVAHRRATA